MRINFLSIAFLGLGVSLFAEAASVQDILNKNNRIVEAPPSSLRANQSSLERRYANNTTLPSENSADDLQSIPVESMHTQNHSQAEVRDERGLGQFLGERNLGIGLISAGAYGVFGTEVDIAIDKTWTAGLGIGTGMTYRTWGVHSRYLFRPSTFTGFVEMGYSNWYLHKASKTGGAIYPQHMATRFLTNESGQYASGARAHLLYPGFGVLYKHKSGMGAIAQVQYFINASGGLQGALGASAGLYLYF